MISDYALRIEEAETGIRLEKGLLRKVPVKSPCVCSSPAALSLIHHYLSSAHLKLLQLKRFTYFLACLKLSVHTFLPFVRLFVSSTLGCQPFFSIDTKKAA